LFITLLMLDMVMVLVGSLCLLLFALRFACFVLCCCVLVQQQPEQEGRKGRRVGYDSNSRKHLLAARVIVRSFPLNQLLYSVEMLPRFDEGSKSATPLLLEHFCSVRRRAGV